MNTNHRRVAAALWLGAVCIALGCSGAEETAFRTPSNNVQDAGVLPLADAAGVLDASMPSGDAAVRVCDPLAAWSQQTALSGLPMAPERLRVSENGLVAAWFDAAHALNLAERSDRAAAFGVATVFPAAVGADASVSFAPSGLSMSVLEPAGALSVYSRAALGTSFDPAQNTSAVRTQVALRLAAGDVLKDTSLRGESGAFFARVQRGSAVLLGTLSPPPRGRTGADPPFEFTEHAFENGAQLMVDERLSFAPATSSVIVTATATSSRLWRLDQAALMVRGPLASFGVGDLSLSADGCTFGYARTTAGAVALSR